MKIIIAGSRSIQDDQLVRLHVHAILSQFSINPSEIISGEATGPDKIGETYAVMMGIPLKKMPANWGLHGRSAGPIRNRQMAEYADMAIVFWDGESRGARNMMLEMSRVKKPCFVYVKES